MDVITIFFAVLAALATVSFIELYGRNIELHQHVTDMERDRKGIAMHRVTDTGSDLRPCLRYRCPYSERPHQLGAHFR